MFPRNLRSVVNIFPSSRTTGCRPNFSVLPVATYHNRHCPSLSVSKYSTKADLETISKLAADAELVVNNEETGVAKREEGALIGTTMIDNYFICVFKFTMIL